MKKITFLLIYATITISYGQNFETGGFIETYKVKQSSNLNLKIEQADFELRLDSIRDERNNFIANYDYDDNNNIVRVRDYSIARPDLNDILYAENNTITVNMLYHNGGTNFKLELSRDNFNTIDFETLIDTTYYKITQHNDGKELLWNTVYQVRVTPVDASEPDLLGSVEIIFPTILKAPSSWDVIDVSAKVNWEPLGQTVTSIKAFASDDLRLTTPLVETSVTEEEFQAGSGVIEGLEPDTNYQIAIYSGIELRGWENYKTLVKEPDYSSVSNLIDLREDANSGAIASALSSAPDGATILVARGNEYSMEGNVALNKSITIRAAYGFGEKRARLLFPYNFDLAVGAEINHLRFIDLELRGSDWTLKYLINISNSGTLNELSIDNCYVTNFRGIGRIKTNGVTLNNYIINNTVVDSINNYGVFTVDNTESTLKNFKLTNSTFNHIIYFLVSRNNSESILIDDCTLANISESGRQLFRWRGGEGKNDVTNGVTISNTIIGHGWDMNGQGDTLIIGREGLDNTTFTISNTFTVSDFSWSSIGSPIEALPVGNAGSTQAELWVDPENNDFNFLDTAFIGKNSSGDPRWYSSENGGSTPLDIHYNWNATSQPYIKVSPTYKSEYAYNENGDPILHEYYHWDIASESFIPEWKLEYAYDENGNRTLYLNYTWNIASASYILWRKTEYSYDVNGNRTHQLISHWDTTTASFTPKRKDEYSYEYNDRTLSLGYTWDTVSASFILSGKDEYSYDENGNQILIVHSLWDTVSASFIPDWKREYSHDADGNVTLFFDYEWDSVTESFINKSKRESDYIYNAYGGYLMSSRYYNWHTQIGDFIPLLKNKGIVILDNETSYVTQQSSYEYDTDNNEWIENGNRYNYYSKTPVLSTPEPEEKRVLIYPNPTTDYLNVKSANEFLNINFVLYDINGRKVFSKMLKTSTQIDVQSLTPALYFYSITADGQTINESGAILKK